MKTYPVVGLLAVAVMGVASAQSGASEPAERAIPGNGPSKGEIKAMRDFRMLDMNGDGRLSRGEVMLFPRLSAAFDDADTNHDQYVSYEEVRAFAARYRAERERKNAAGVGTAGSRVLP